MKELRIKSYAKINLILDCLFKRTDHYHEVEMVMQAINLYDTIILSPSDKITVETNHPLVPDDKGNIAFQAALAIQERYPQVKGVKINIKKSIPVEAGLAGGSSNGASVIIGLDRLFSLQMTKIEMLEIGAKLGSDVPFFMEGPTALAKGRGEIVSSIHNCPLIWLVLIKPQFGVKTPDVYKNLDLQNVKYHPNLKAYLDALENGNVQHLFENLYNGLEASTFELYPEVKEIKEYLGHLGAKSVLMSGSGPTVFGLFRTEDEAQGFAKGIEKDIGQVFITHTVDNYLYHERMN